MYKLKEILKNFSFALGSNIISFIISVLVTIIVPKQISVEGYGYFQLYIFYTSYIGFLHFGWTDGMCLRYAGTDYKDLNYAKFSGQFWIYSIIEIVFGLAIMGYGLLTSTVADKSIILFLTGIAVCLVLPKTMLHTLLYTTNRIREYSVANIGEKVIYIGIILLGLLFGAKRYEFLIVSDIIGKLFSMIYVLVKCKTILYAKPCSIKITLSETQKNIAVGINIMLATIASNLIIGIVRLAISNVWSAEIFGKVSLTISVSNMLLLMIGAVSLVLFPILKKFDDKKLSQIYSLMRSCLMIPLLGLLITYYPAKQILSVWLPQYSDSLQYMALLFPMCIFGSKMSMLVTTYMKTLRKERWLLLVNVVTVTLSGITTMITVYWLHNLDLAVASIVFLLAFRCVFAELLLSAVLDVSIKTDIVLELVLTVVFIGASWFVGGIIGLVIYALSYAIYLIIKRNDVVCIINMIVRLVHYK